MAPENWCKKKFLIIFAQNAKKRLFNANFNEIWLTNHVFNVSQSLFWFCICTWLCFLHFQKIFIKIAINWVFTVRFKKFKSLYNFSPFLFNLLWKIHWRTLFCPISSQKKRYISTLVFRIKIVISYSMLLSYYFSNRTLNTQVSKDAKSLLKFEIWKKTEINSILLETKP